MAHLQSRIIAQDSTADRFAFFHSRLSILMWHTGNDQFKDAAYPQVLDVLDFQSGCANVVQRTPIDVWSHPAHQRVQGIHHRTDDRIGMAHVLHQKDTATWLDDSFDLAEALYRIGYRTKYARRHCCIE